MNHIEQQVGLPIAAFVGAPQLAVGLGVTIAGLALAIAQLA